MILVQDNHMFLNYPWLSVGLRNDEPHGFSSFIRALTNCMSCCCCFLASRSRSSRSARRAALNCPGSKSHGFNHGKGRFIPIVSLMVIHNGIWLNNWRFQTFALFSLTNGWLVDCLDFPLCLRMVGGLTSTFMYFGGWVIATNQVLFTVGTCGMLNWQADCSGMNE